MTLTSVQRRRDIQALPLLTSMTYSKRRFRTIPLQEIPLILKYLYPAYVLFMHSKFSRSEKRWYLVDWHNFHNWLKTAFFFSEGCKEKKNPCKNTQLLMKLLWSLLAMCILTQGDTSVLMYTEEKCCIIYLKKIYHCEYVPPTVIIMWRKEPSDLLSSTMNLPAFIKLWFPESSQD